MDLQLIILLLLTMVIHLVGTCAYAFRIAAVRTGQIAVAFSLFNVLVLVSRTSNSFQAPLIAKRVENALLDPSSQFILLDLRLVLASAFVATVAGGLLVPTLQRLATHAVAGFRRHRSLILLLWAGMGRTGLIAVRDAFAAPGLGSLLQLRIAGEIPWSMIAISIFANALWTVAVLASIYAGYLFPDFRLTAMSLSAVINGVATIFLFLIIDPFVAMTTDESAQKRGDAGVEARYRRIIVWMVMTKALGTLAAQLFLVPGARLIATIAAAL
jgi:Alternate to MurJ